MEKLNEIKFNPCAQKCAGSVAFRSFTPTCYDRRVADLQLTLDIEAVPSSDLHFYKLYFPHQLIFYYHSMRMRDINTTARMKMKRKIDSIDLTSHSR